MGANKPIEDIEATLLAATKSALDELVGLSGSGVGHTRQFSPPETWHSQMTPLAAVAGE
jgi:hypothetical protein